MPNRIARDRPSFAQLDVELLDVEPSEPPPARRQAEPHITPAQRRQLFAEHYLKTHNATQAAKLAGLAPASAKGEGHKMLDHPHVKALLADGLAADRRRAARAARKVTLERQTILDELARLAFSNVLDFGRIEHGQFVLDLSETPRAEMAAVRKLRVDERVLTVSGNSRVIERQTVLELAPKREALVALGQALGLFDGSPEQAATVVNFNLIGLNAPSHPERQLVDASARVIEPNR